MMGRWTVDLYGHDNIYEALVTNSQSFSERVDIIGVKKKPSGIDL